jgi:hypothetical protein
MTENNNLSLYIYASFARSYDFNHVKTKKIHLISSIVSNCRNYHLDLNLYLNTITQKKGDNLYFLFIITNEPETIYINSYNIYIENGGNIEIKNIVIFSLTLDQLIGHLTFIAKDNALFENIFGNKELTEKDFDLIYQNSFFIFKDMFWSNILLKFKIGGIQISGGNISKRHILSTVELQLVENIFYMCGGCFDFKKFVYESNKQTYLSKNLELDIYRCFKGVKDNFNKLNLTELKNIDTFVEYEGNISEDKLLYLNKIVKNNLLLSFDTLKSSIIEQYTNVILQIKFKIENLELDCSRLKNEIYELENINYVSTSNMSVKSKKKFKKERTLILNDPNYFSNINDLTYKLTKLSNKIENFQQTMAEYEKILEEFKINFLKKNLSELIELDKKLNLSSENKTLKYSKINKKNTAL